MSGLDRHCDEAEEFMTGLSDSEAEDLQTQMCECAHSETYNTKDVYQIDSYHKDAINVKAHICVNWHGKEYHAIVRSGDLDGFVIEEWSDDAHLGEPPRPAEYALMPSSFYPNICSVEPEKASTLFRVWNTFRENREDFNELAGKYMYDKHFAPGFKTESYWRKKAAEYAAVIVLKEEAEEAFQKLKDHYQQHAI